MTQNIFEYEITDPGDEAEIAEDAFSAIQGDLRFDLDGKVQLFDRVPLVMASSSMLDQVVKVLMFDDPDQRRTVVIPDHEPVLGLQMTSEGTLEVSVVLGGEALACARCNPLGYARAAGSFHEAMVRHMARIEPHLLDLWHLTFPDPAASILAERQGVRPTFQVLD